MYRCLWMGSIAALLLVGSTGCLHHNLRSGGCGTGACSTGSCGTSACSTGSCGSTGGDCGCQVSSEPASVGVLGRLCNRGGGCNTGACSTGACGTGDCGGGCNGGCGGGTGLLGRLGRKAGLASCGCGAGRNGCVAGPLGWQQGGLDYSSHLQPGLLGHNAGQQLNSRPFTPGPPTGQVAYPYYSVRGPRDFFVDNPPTIGR